MAQRSLIRQLALAALRPLVQCRRYRNLAPVFAGLTLLILLLPVKAHALAFDGFFAEQSIPMLWIDPASGRIVEVNKAASDFYGYSKNALQDMTIQQINTFDQNQVADEMAAAKKAGRNYFIFRHRLADGDVRTVEVYSHPYERQGNRLLLSVIHDITPGRNLDEGMWHYQARLEELVAIRTAEAAEQSKQIILMLIAGLVMAVGAVLALSFVMRKRRKAEQESQRFKAIADNAIYGNIISDFDGRVIYVNPFFAQVHGYQADELLGQSLSLFHTETQMEEINSLIEHLKQHGHIPPKEIWHLHKDGHTFPMLMSSSVMQNRDGEPAYFATAALDLTEQHRERQHTENVLIEARQEAEAASQAKSDFLANMSHEIRTPLNAIIGLSEFQLGENLPKDQHDHLQQIHHSGQLLLGIVNDLLDFSKIEAGKMDLVVEPFNMNDVIKQLSTLFGLASSEKGIELMLKLPASIPHWYKGDFLRLTQVLTNLMANAVKFTEEGRVELHIEGLDVTDETARLRFLLIDTGIGMTEQQQENLFKAFSQADTSITRRHGGTGLGLIISQRLVSLMQGDGIHMTSEAGVGSRFYFDLDLPLAQPELNEAVPVICHRNPCRALVVDDQSITREILREILESWHFEVEEAADGLQAVDKVQKALQQEHLFDVILMDWEMPHMNGDEALRVIRQAMMRAGMIHRLPVMLMVSAHDRSAIALDHDEDVQYLPKPIHRSNLYDALSDLHRRYSYTPAESHVEFCGQQVLVVEDNPINQQVVQAQLEQMNLKITLADNGRAGVDAVRGGQFDLVLMDIQMPVLDGYQATREIRRFDAGIPIVALTAAALVEDREKALQAGMNDHLGKPFTAKQLFAHLRPWLETQDVPAEPDTETSAEPEQKDGPQTVKASAAQEALTEPKPDVSDIAALPAMEKQRTVLIVDDMVANVKVLANLLKDEYLVKVAGKGQKALEIAKSDNPPDLILLDILMPDIDGYDVCRELKGDPSTSRIPLIFISALDEARDEAKGLNLGAVDYITKPYHPEIVKARVRSHMNLKVKTDLLEQMSNIDGLTQVANRRYFDVTLDKEVKRLSRSGHPLALVMLDIDHFKPFNDNYGHGKGDECLAKVAAALKQEISRPGDLFARYGGEEFVAILPETDAEGAERVAESMRQAVEQLQITHEYSEVADCVTVSLGCIAQPVTDETPEQLLKKVDQALYQAKERGRNQVVLAEFQGASN